MHWELAGDGSGVPRPRHDFPAGTLYGYNVYTTFRWPIEERWLQAHLDRLESNANALGLSWHWTRAELIRTLEQCYQPDMPVVRLTVLADVSSYGDFYEQDPLPSQLILSVRQASEAKRPLSLKAIPYQRPLSAIKVGGTAELIQFKRQARSAGLDDVLLVNPAGHLCEASTANIFCIRDDTLYTPNPERDGCLPGITRLRILEIAGQAGLSVADEPIPVDSLSTMDGAFLCNAAQGISPIKRIITPQAHLEFLQPDRTPEILGILRRGLG